MSKIEILKNIVIIVYNYTKTFHLYCAQEMIFHDSEWPHSWNPVHQAKSFFNHEVILSQTSLELIWILTELLWVFLRRSAWIVWGVTRLATERRNCVLESKPVGSTNSSWCSIKAYSTLNPINQTSSTNGSVPELHLSSWQSWPPRVLTCLGGWVLGSWGCLTSWSWNGDASL